MAISTAISSREKTRTPQTNITTTVREKMKQVRTVEVEIQLIKIKYRKSKVVCKGLQDSGWMNVIIVRRLKEFENLLSYVLLIIVVKIQIVMTDFE